MSDFLGEPVDRWIGVNAGESVGDDLYANLVNAGWAKDWIDDVWFGIGEIVFNHVRERVLQFIQPSMREAAPIVEVGPVDA